MVKTMQREQIGKPEYNIHNDYRFPMSLMHRGFYILEKYGQEAFDRFALKTKMPMQDVERIWNKYRCKVDPEFKVTIDAEIQKIKDKMGVQVKI